MCYDIIFLGNPNVKIQTFNKRTLTNSIKVEKTNVIINEVSFDEEL